MLSQRRSRGAGPRAFAFEGARHAVPVRAGLGAAGVCVDATSTVIVKVSATACCRPKTLSRTPAFRCVFVELG